MAEARKRTGDLGEKLARQYLARNGYEILEQNYRCSIGEIDIVARDGNSLTFVEVRTKRSKQFGTPEESVTPAKQAKLIELAQTYLQKHEITSEDWRIDVVAVELKKDKQVSRIELIKNAVGE